jgi:hypothetical protein
MAYYAPKLFQHYVEVLGALHDRDPALEWNFSNSAFPSATINFGPEAVCFDHLDYFNKAIGWCDICSLGDYDPQKGGHLILFDIKRVIQFPPGSHILIPSALMRHGNTPIQKGEIRRGFTQYAAGALFRWVDNGYMRAEDVKGKRKEELEVQDPSRYGELLNLYSTLDNLVQDRMDVFGK